MYNMYVRVRDGETELEEMRMGAAWGWWGEDSVVWDTFLFVLLGYKVAANTRSISCTQKKSIENSKSKQELLFNATFPTSYIIEFSIGQAVTQKGYF